MNVLYYHVAPVFRRERQEEAKKHEDAKTELVWMRFRGLNILAHVFGLYSVIQAQSGIDPKLVELLSQTAQQAEKEFQKKQSKSDKQSIKLGVYVFVTCACLHVRFVLPNHFDLCVVCIVYPFSAFSTLSSDHYSHEKVSKNVPLHRTQIISDSGMLLENWCFLHISFLYQYLTHCVEVVYNSLCIIYFIFYAVSV